MQLFSPSPMTCSKNSNLDKKCVPFLFFFDLKKAFDSVSHHQLLDLLAWYRLDTHTLSWITGYLTNRKQHEVIDRETSSETPVLSGIPQGSVLGPLLGLVYLDDQLTPIRRNCA